MNRTETTVHDVIADFKRTRAIFREALGSRRLDELLPNSDGLIPPGLVNRPYFTVQLALISDLFHRTPRGHSRRWRSIP